MKHSFLGQNWIIYQAGAEQAVDKLIRDSHSERLSSLLAINLLWPEQAGQARLIISFYILLITELAGWLTPGLSPLVDMPAAEPPAHHHAVAQPHRGVAVSRLGQVGQLAGGGGAHHLH